MTVEYITSIAERYQRLGYDPYRWFQADDAPAFMPLKKPLSASRLGVLTTSGAYVIGQVAFFYKDDTSVRAIPRDTPVDQIHFSHITENYLADPRKDPNCILPLEALRDAERSGRIGELSPDFFSCMGGVYSQRRVREEMIPDLASRFRAQAVDAVLLVPM